VVESVVVEAVEEGQGGDGTKDDIRIARVAGEALTKLPDDLYIPPDALEVFLETFEGPLDLLLYLIRRQNIDICDIPIAEITAQYVEYVELMREIRLDLAAEYLVMAATLAEIKSRMLLPRRVEDDGEEVDPRQELVARLQQYERFKKAAEDVDQLPRVSRDVFPIDLPFDVPESAKPLPETSMQELLKALHLLLKRSEDFVHHQVKREQLSIRERMSSILQRLDTRDFVRFENFFTEQESRMGVVVTFIAMLELLKGGMIEIVQAEPFSPIHLRAAA
jgi:segregation and condensation protein A|tara:strand:- start:2634 stop:3467 length:834 start_codon:yes stop_codon:yes gene_type:complete